MTNVFHSFKAFSKKMRVSLRVGVSTKNAHTSQYYDYTAYNLNCPSKKDLSINRILTLNKERVDHCATIHLSWYKNFTPPNSLAMIKNSIFSFYEL